MKSEITAKTIISGFVNGEPIKGKVVATIDTDRGGRSSCEFSELPAGFNPAIFGTHTWTSHHTSAGLSRLGDNVFNLYDLTRGNYRVFRAVSYPDHPEHQVLFDVAVEARGSEWATTIYLIGTYKGPTDVVANRNYQVGWMVDGGRLLESGSVELELSSGEFLRQRWSSIITPSTKPGTTPAVLERFPPDGQLVQVSISPFEVRGDSMTYEWEGTVKAQSSETRQPRTST